MVLARQQPAGRVGLDEAARIAGMTKSGVSALVKLVSKDGRPFVRESCIKNSKGAKTRLFDASDLEQFRLQHVSLKEIADNAKSGSKAVKMKLDVEGIEPVAPKYELGRIWYRRCDLPDF